MRGWSSEAALAAWCCQHFLAGAAGGKAFQLRKEGLRSPQPPSLLLLKFFCPYISYVQLLRTGSLMKCSLIK